MNDDSAHVMSITLPAKLRERAGKIAKKRGMSPTALIREALIEKIEALEEKERLERERERREQEERQARIQRRTLGSLGSPLAPASTSLAPPTFETRAATIANGDDPADDVYLRHAKRIREVIDTSPTEKRLRVGEALRAIKEQCPLTHPGDDEILLHLERLINQLRITTPPPQSLREEPPRDVPDASGAIGRAIGGFIGRAIDANVPTYGDAPDDDK